MLNPSQGEILRSSSRTYIKKTGRSNRPPPSSSLWWIVACKLCTLLIPGFVLSCFGMRTKSVQMAWREKVTLCLCVVFACLCLAFLTYGMNTIVCRGDSNFVLGKLHRTNFEDRMLIAKGQLYTIERTHKHEEALASLEKKNLTSLFPKNVDSCKRLFGKQVIARGVEETNLTLKDDKDLRAIGKIHFSWADIVNLNFIVIGEKVYDPSYCTESYYRDFISTYQGKDATKNVGKFSKDELSCFTDTFYAGDLEKKSYGCLLADFLLYLSTVAIFGLIITRFILATVYSWSASKTTRRLLYSERQESKTPCILFVTCYSEGREGLKSTIDSLCAQEYNYDYKLIIVVADGIIKGSENTETTPDILLSLIERDLEFEDEPRDYIALAAGEKRHNRAVVYPGFYRTADKTTRILLIIKCGNPAEESGPKPGNRGKRDSQVIIMGFFQRLIYKERMTPLDFDLYVKMKHCMPRFSPEQFECILMVDADTVVRSDALSHMVRMFASDHKIMGMCGETKITNKCESWVTMIQVFEYYISHHLSKSFESVFGGVTCLPGCFCMYRIQIFSVSERGKETLPILAHPFILDAYSVFETTTLHQKNLLLLGEDRYLTTLLLKTFYRKKLIFLPAAKCETLVPAEFGVLLSQRRRWINSTVHNLFELVLVNKLCGTFCCSMQFVVIMELMGTLVLPAAIIFTGVLLVTSVLIEPAIIPLVMLVGILGLPAVLILLTTREISYLFWIVVYILSLPIWNFVLPTYAYWHFDDFSWGETRKIEGCAGTDHGDAEGVFDPNTIPLRHMEEMMGDADRERGECDN